ncbi:MULTISPECIES: hypothetical protein [Rhodococcus]|uniref:Uncharacterized protein n=1 Tax=Rhodococcus opacus RKJ300 = JCM 13270 TaxID=1165867 RepID=I0WDM0_RHOOP|nr:MULTISPECIES: hypothetical protein [Rhodococcus]EID74486.1 hypothetical protein W59_29924 [Rhodococcus opacus RKJ300 = JCM 13270]QQZ18453.1 hypothetical protein GO592_40455 [Rhodococcus sp. 21391]
MDVHIGEMDATVRAVDDRSLLSPDVIDAVTQAVLQRLDQRRADEARRHDDATPWASVRSGGC